MTCSLVLPLLSVISTAIILSRSPLKNAAVFFDGINGVQCMEHAIRIINGLYTLNSDYRSNTHKYSRLLGSFQAGVVTKSKIISFMSRNGFTSCKVGRMFCNSIAFSLYSTPSLPHFFFSFSEEVSSVFFPIHRFFFNRFDWVFSGYYRQHKGQKRNNRT